MDIGAAFEFLARRRWAALGLAICGEAAALAALSLASPNTVLGLPAAIVVGSAGTIAVVLGPRDGALVAGAGAVVFGLLNGWSAGGLAALAVWPLVVVATGWFARQVERRRRLLFRTVIDTEERHRSEVAGELHDGVAQTLSGALMALAQRGDRQPVEVASGTSEARLLVRRALRDVRAAAGELHPRMIADFGLAHALEQLAMSLEAAGVTVEVDADRWHGRLPAGLELALYRISEDLAKHAVSCGATSVRIGLARSESAVQITVESTGEGRADPASEPPEAGLRAVHGRVEMLGGRLEVSAADPARTRVVADVPLAA